MPTLSVRKLDTDAVLPTRANPGDAGLDLYAIQDTYLTETPVAVPTGIAIEIPTGYAGFVQPKSGLTLKGVGVILGLIDSGYRGELKVMMYSLYPDQHQQLVKHSKIAQLVLVKIGEFDPVEVHSLNDTVRGDNGFGSSGYKYSLGGNYAN